MKKLAHYRKEADNLRAIEHRMDSTGETQVSLTDPDCRAMATTSKQPRVVGYNVQSAVETKHHLIVAHEVRSTSASKRSSAETSRRAGWRWRRPASECWTSSEPLQRRCRPGPRDAPARPGAWQANRPSGVSANSPLMHTAHLFTQPLQHNIEERHIAPGETGFHNVCLKLGFGNLG